MRWLIGGLKAGRFVLIRGDEVEGYLEFTKVGNGKDMMYSFSVLFTTAFFSIIHVHYLS